MGLELGLYLILTLTLGLLTILFFLFFFKTFLIGRGVCLLSHVRLLRRIRYP